MKKLSALLVIVVFFVTACISFQIGNTEKELIAKMAARHVGFEVEKRYPDVAREVLVMSKGILVAEEGGTISIVIDRIISVLTDEIDDPMLALDIQDLVGMIKIKADVKITESQMAIVKAVAKGLIEGIEKGE